MIAPVDTLVGTSAVLQSLLYRDDYPHGDTVRNVIATLVSAYVSDEANHQPVMVNNAPPDREFPWA
jgi:hypothetical protein